MKTEKELMNPEFALCQFVKSLLMSFPNPVDFKSIVFLREKKTSSETNEHSKPRPALSSSPRGPRWTAQMPPMGLCKDPIREWTGHHEGKASQGFLLGLLFLPLPCASSFLLLSALRFPLRNPAPLSITGARQTAKALPPPLRP